MRQRKKKSARPAVIFAAVCAVLVLGALVFGGAAGGKFSGAGHEKFGTFSASAFIENPKTHAGNKYRVEGMIDNILGSTGAGDSVTRLVSLSVDGGHFIPVLVPAKAVPFALQRTQGIVALCTINNDGLPVAEAVEKK
jgi:hypothetical protein